MTLRIILIQSALVDSSFVAVSGRCLTKSVDINPVAVMIKEINMGRCPDWHGRCNIYSRNNNLVTE